ncbi:MAG: P-loop NTPase fold protein [Marinagarivorans sp.]
MIFILVIAHIISTTAKWKKIISRWLTITAYSAIGATLNFLLLNQFFPALTPPKGWYRLFETQPFVYLLLALLIFAATLFLARHFKVWNENHTPKSALARPNLFVAVGMAGIFLELAWQKPLLILVYWLPLIASLLPSLALLQPQKKTKIESEANESESSTEELSEQALKEWLLSEKPFPPNTPWLIDYTGIEERISNLFFDNNNKFKPTNFALVANYGMGKTSLLMRLENIINERLKTSELNKTKIVAVTIDCWGRDAKSLDMQIISEIVNTLAKHTDVSALYSLPQHYHNALTSPRGITGFISHLLNGQNRDTKKVLSGIENVLIQLDLQLLIIIEDIDRNQDSSYAALNIVSSVLDRLNKISNTSVAVSLPNDALLQLTEDRKDCFDPKGILRRVLLFKEYIYKPNYNDIIFKFTTMILNHATNNGVNYCETPKTPEGIWTDLIESPRHLKQIFREIYHIWIERGLYGEIDINDLFILAAIKHDSNQATTELRESRKKFLPTELQPKFSESIIPANTAHTANDTMNMEQIIKKMDAQTLTITRPFAGISCPRIGNDESFNAHIYNTFFTGRSSNNMRKVIKEINDLIANPFTPSTKDIIEDPKKTLAALQIIALSAYNYPKLKKTIEQLIKSITTHTCEFNSSHQEPLHLLHALITPLIEQERSNRNILHKLLSDKKRESSYQSYWWLYLGLFGFPDPERHKVELLSEENNTRESALTQRAREALENPNEEKNQFLIKSIDFIAPDCDEKLQEWKDIFYREKNKHQENE